jgi:xeroderma pigmentosum group C-complementing protein
MDVDPAENGADAAMRTLAETIPMTMQELAEAAAKKQSVEQDTNAVKGNSITSNAVGNQSVRTLHSQKSSRQSTPSKATKTRRGVAPATKGRGATKSRTAMDRNRSARKRRQSSEDGESHVDSESSHGDHFESDHDDDDDPPPKKRRRAPASSSAKPAPSPPTRVLRPRRSKTQAQVEADQAQEEAFRRAAVV